MATTPTPWLPARKASAYTVAWLCALPEVEYPAAIMMLDHDHKEPDFHNASDNNQYWFGDLGGHNVVIASMPANKPSKVSAQILVAPLQQSFPNLKIHLFVGIGGGVPQIPQPEDPLKDVRLGDVVIGWPEETGDPAIVQYDFARRLSRNQFDLLGHMDNPKPALLNGLNNILVRRTMRRPTGFANHLEKLEEMEGYGHPGAGTDILFDADYRHVEGKPNCDDCDPKRRVQRQQRSSEELVFHRSTILSGDTLEMDAIDRDKLSHKYFKAKCFEMEAAGVMGDLRCLVVRGISDYADTHKNYRWHKYAAGRAAAFAREYLIGIRVDVMKNLSSGISDNSPRASLPPWFSPSDYASQPPRIEDSPPPRRIETITSDSLDLPFVSRSSPGANGTEALGTSSTASCMFPPLQIRKPRFPD